MAVMMRRGAPLLINRISRLMGDRRLTIQDVARGTGLSRKTIGELYHASTTRIDLQTLDLLCAFFKVGPEQVFEWVPPQAEPDGGDRREA